jgi:hypothetical protein
MCPDLAMFFCPHDEQLTNVCLGTKGGSPSQCRLVTACSPAYIVMSHYNGHTVLGTVQSLLCARVDLSLIIIMGLQRLLEKA